MVPSIIVGKNNVHKIDIVLVRVTKDPMKPIGMAKPCSDCLDFLKVTNVRYVYYTNDNGILVMEKAADMMTNHICRKHKAHNHKLNKFK